MGVRISLQAGYRVRPETESLNLIVDDEVFGAGGIGVAEGFATPDWRLLAGVRLHSSEEEAKRRELLRTPPKPVDPDPDGILGDADACPMQPEDVDAFEDTDGCDDIDNDKDTVLDVNDSCRDVFGVVDHEGCPEPDRDGDKVVDRLDVCPETPGLPPRQRSHGVPHQKRRREGSTPGDRLWRGASQGGSTIEK